MSTTNFSLKVKSSKGSSRTPSIMAYTRRLEATTLDAAKAEAKVIADEEVGIVELLYNFGETAIHMATIRASRAARTEYAAWRAARAS